jgi:hypothetical protein
MSARDSPVSDLGTVAWLTGDVQGRHRDDADADAGDEGL